MTIKIYFKSVLFLFVFKAIKKAAKKVRPKSDVTVTHCAMCKNLQKGFLQPLTPSVAWRS